MMTGKPLGQKTIILGAGGFARETAVVLASLNHYIYGYVSDNLEQRGWKYEYAECLGPIESVKDSWIQFIPGIGSPSIRKKLVKRALGMNWKPMNAISSQAFIPRTTGRKWSLDCRGLVICSGVSATINITLGNYINVNLNCTLGHDCTIEDYVNLSPNVNVSGYVHIEEAADIGTGAVLLPKVRIGKSAVIGAGAVVTKNVPAGEVWAGIPAKPIRKT